MPQFRTKARAVELLGKGQIADLPTAITELWKNGYDAYATNLDAHLFCSEYKGLKNPLFVISDDGSGMSEDELLNKWIVIGTDSKVQSVKDKKGKDTLGKKPRIKTGEKGIGRLSVSYLGNQMLLLTKKQDGPIYSLFFDWRVLDNFNLYLEDIQIPLMKVDDPNNFPLIFKNLKQAFINSLKSQSEQQWKEYQDLYDMLINETKHLELPTFFYEKIIDPFYPQKEKGHGTKFIIFDPIEQISELMSADKPDADISDGTFYNISSLSGLANHFINEEKDFRTNFFVYKSEIPIDIIQQREFFTYDDFKKCDHLIDGTFDSKGHFKGSIRIYTKTINYEFKPNRPPGKSPYGPFDIKVGYIPGKEDTILPDDQFDKYNKMLQRYGGFYIYRDGFRVLPYGRIDQDFLKFEERRTRGAGYYFFSYRRMFGYAAISRENNSDLRDKSGREGFVNNKAYREFQEDLSNFFVDLAAKYFRTKPEFSYKADQLKKFKEEKLEKEREQEERKEFNKCLTKYPDLLNDYNNQLSDLLDKLDTLVGKSKIIYEKIEELLKNIDKNRSLLREIIPPSPKRFKPTDNQREKLHLYSKNYQKIFDSVEERYQNAYKAAKEKLREKELLEEFNRKIASYTQEFKITKNDFDGRIKKITNNFVNEIENLSKNIFSHFETEAKRLEPKKLNRSELESSLELLDNIYLEYRRSFEEKINPFLQHLERLNINIDEDKLIGYYKIQYEEIKKLWQETQELAQLGIAVEIIDHQFNALYSQLANIIGMFKNSIKEDKSSKNLYSLLVSSFDHLQNNYKFLTPLYRTTGHTKKNISGKEIKSYISAFFSEKLHQDNIELSSSKEFDQSDIFTYESIIKPVFINIVNNAVYWLTSAEEKKIHLEYENGIYLVMNSGQPIDDIYIKDDIFKLFFSRKPKGRGIGLYLAKTTLNSIGFDVEATNDPEFNRLNGACFMIKQIEK